MKKLLFLFLFIFFQLASCQPAAPKEAFQPNLEGFCIQDSLFYYNGKKINITIDISSLTSVLGNYNRIHEDLTRNYTTTRWYWGNNKHYAYYYSTDSLINFRNGISDRTEEYKTIKEIEKKYGKPDSSSIQNIVLERMDNRYHIWDSLGVQAVSVNDSLREIHFFTDHNRLIKRDTDPRNIYTGKLTINGVTLDLAERKFDTWTSSMKALGILSKDNAPPGDSKDWTRYLRTPYFVFTFSRANNILSEPFNYNNVKKIPDYLDEISIGINTVAFDKLKKSK